MYIMYVMYEMHLMHVMHETVRLKEVIVYGKCPLVEFSL